MTSGAFGIMVANPTDVVKIRLQAQGVMPKEEWRYNGSIDCYKKTFAADGVKGFYVGVLPNIMRNSIINAAELATFDQAMQFAINNCGLQNSLPLHTFCAFLAGFAAVCCGSPVDVLKTRLMNRLPGDPSNPFTMIAHMFKNEGPLAFYKGFTSNFLRIGSWNVVMFITLEQLKMHEPW